MGPRRRREPGSERRRDLDRFRPTVELTARGGLLRFESRRRPQRAAVDVAVGRIGVSRLPTSIHPLDGSSMQEDPSLGRLVLCGCDLAGGLSPEMWVWNGRDWTKGPYPQPPVAPEALVIDPANSQFLVLGSAIAGADALTQTVQVWAVRGTQWLRLGVGFSSG